MCFCMSLCRSAYSYMSMQFSDSTLSSDLLSAKLSGIFCQFIVTLRVNGVRLYVCVCMWVWGCLRCSLLMLICPSGRHYQFVASPLLCSLNSNITQSLQFPPAATGPDLSRSYQRNSLMTIKLSGWTKHQHTCAYIYSMNTYRHSHMSCVIDGNTVFMPFLSHFTTWEYTALTREKGNQFYAGNYLHTIFWQKL